MKTWTRLRLWWYRRMLHQYCATNQILIWVYGSGAVVPHGACTKCFPRMVWIREQYMARARLLP